MGRKPDGPARGAGGPALHDQGTDAVVVLGYSRCLMCSITLGTGTVGLNLGMEREISLTNGFRKIKSSGLLG